MSDERQHQALRWVERNFPDARGAAKAALILAYGAGLDAGFAESLEIFKEIQAQHLANT